MKNLIPQNAENQQINLNLSKEEINLLIEALYYAPKSLNEESKNRPSYEEGNRILKCEMRELREKLHNIKHNW